MIISTCELLIWLVMLNGQGKLKQTVTPKRRMYQDTSRMASELTIITLCITFPRRSCIEIKFILVIFLSFYPNTHMGNGLVCISRMNFILSKRQYPMPKAEFFNIIISSKLRSPKWPVPSRHTDTFKLHIIPWRREAVYHAKRLITACQPARCQRRRPKYNSHIHGGF